MWPFRTRIPQEVPKKSFSKLKQRVSDLESDLRRVRADGIDTHERLTAAIGRWSARKKAMKEVDSVEEPHDMTDDELNTAIQEGTYKG